MYCHIAGRFETDFDKVLKSEGDTSSSKSIQRFEKLFSEYQAIKPKAQSFSTAESKLKAFNNAVDFGFIKSISSEKEKTGKAQDLFSFESKATIEATNIKRKLKTLRFTRSHLQSEIASIQKLGKIANVSSDELKLLHSYFPNVNIEKIENVQSFHFSLANIVNTECKSEEEKLTEELNEVNAEIEELEKKISPELKDIPQTILEEYGKKSVRIEQIEKALELTALKKKIAEEKDKAEKALQSSQKNGIE